MPAYEVSVVIQFDAAHRLYDYKGKCHNLHGHTYFATVEVACGKLVSPGIVVDFGVLKKAVKSWINGSWDHATILWEFDPLVRILKDQGLRVYGMNKEPTAENMAELLLNVVRRELPDTVVVTAVSIMETPTSTATYIAGSVVGLRRRTD